MGLLNELQNQGLLSNSEKQVAEGLDRAKRVVSQRKVGGQATPYTNAYLDDTQQQLDYLSTQISKQQARNEETGLLSYGNLTSTNPIVNWGTNALNMGAQVAGSLVDLAASTAGGVNVSNANSLYAGLPEDIKGLYQREQWDNQRAENNASLVGYQNAIANGQLNDLIGYDKQFKTRTELDNHIKELQSQVNSKPLSAQELARLEAPDGRVMVQNSLLTPLRNSYRHVFNQINTNYEDDRRWRGNEKKGVDNFFGSRSWGNDYAMKDFQEDFQQTNQANRTLDQQGAFQRANANFGSDDWLEGAGKSLAAFRGSVGSAVDAVGENPASLLQMAAQTAPFLFGRTANAAFAGDANRILAEGSQQIADRNGTPAIDGLDAIGNAAAAGAYTGLNFAERAILLGGLTGRTGQAIDRATEGVQSAASRVANKVADSVPQWLESTARTAAALTPTRSMGILARNAATTGAMEGAVEMLQTQIEDSWSQGKLDVNAEHLAQAGVLGAALGSIMSVPGSVIDYGTSRIAENANQRVEEQLGNQEVSNDDLLNVDNPAYAPAKVINRIMAEELPNQNYEQAQARINEVVQSTASVLDGLSQEIQTAENPDALSQRITRGNELLENFRTENTPETNPNYDAIIENYSAQIDGLQQQYDRITAPDFDIEMLKGQQSRIQEALVEMEGPYKQFNDAMSSYTAASNPQPTETTTEPEQDLGVSDEPSDVSTAQSEPTQTNVPETVEDVSTEATRHLGAPTPSNLARIQELSEDVNVPEATRNNLRIVADALIKANQQKDIGTVNKEVTKGVKGFRGTEQYIDEMAKAIDAGDTGRQESLSKQMDYFVKSRQSKLDAIQQAQEIADSGNKQVQVYKEATGGWVANEGKSLPRSEFNRNNGIVVNPRVGNGRGADALVEAISSELALITATADALQAMRNGTAMTANGEANALRDQYMSDRNTTATPIDPMQQALDDFNAVERQFGRDTTARDTDANATTVEQKPKKGKSATPKQGSKGSDTKPDVAVPEPKKAEKFNYRSKFADEAKAKKYLEQFGKTDAYHIIDNAEGGKSIRKNPTAAQQPKASADATVVVENEQANLHSTIVPAAQVSEQATEATQTQSIEVEPITTYEENTEQTPTVDKSPEGGISSLDTGESTYTETTAEEKAKPYSLQNLLRSSFIQRIKDGFNSPLVTTPNFISAVKERSRKAIVDMVNETIGEQPSEAQILLINDFMNFNKAHGVNKYLRTAIKANKNPEYHHKYYSDFLLNEQGQLDENVATAISLAMYSWVGESANSIYADKASLSKILGVKNVDSFPPSITSRIGTIGTHQKTLAASLGQRVYQTLQLKMLKDVSPDRQAKLEQVLGTLAIGAMVDLGLAERTRITNGELYAMANVAEGTLDAVDPALWVRKPAKSVDMERLNNKAMTYFIRPALAQDSNGRYKATNFNKRIADMHKGTRGILSRIFNFEPYTTLPSLEPITTLPATYNDFGGKLPSMVKEALLDQQSLAYNLNMEMVDVASTLSSTAKGQQTLLDILGYQDPMNSHAAFAESIESVNDGIKRSMNLLDDTVKAVGDQDFYLQSTLWSNFRNGNVAGFNPQGDKIHRGFVSLKNDAITVPLTAKNEIFDANGELTQYGMFLRGLAFRMEDVKIQGNAVDKTLVAEFLPMFHDYINSPEVRSAADALQKVMDGTHNSTSDLDTLRDLLVGWEMGALGLSALMAINARNQAIDNGETSFDVMMAADSDGLVNGPAITNVLMHSANAEFFQSIGVTPFAKEGQDQITSMQQWRKKEGALDPYEQLAAQQKIEWNALPRDNSYAGKAVRALDFVDKAYGQRAGAKRALTPFNYGAGFDAVNRANARGTLEAVYKGIERAGRDYSQGDRQSIANIAKAINVLIDYHNSTTTGRKVNFVDPAYIANMDNMLSPQQEAAVMNADMLLRGFTTTTALTNTMGDYIALRNGKTSLANSLFEAFNAVYETKKSQMETANNIDVTNEGLPADKLQQLLRESMAYMPTLATPMGIKSKDTKMSGIPLVDVGKHWNDLKTVEVKFNTGFGHVFTPESSSLPSGAKDRINESTTLKSDIREKVFQTPGVGSIALYIQSHDAFVTYSVMKAMDAQNFHDANSTNAYDLVKMAKVQNKAFLEATSTSHMGKAFIDATITGLQGFVDNLADIPVDKVASVKAAIAKTLETNGVNSSDLKVGLSELVGKYLQSDIDKLIMLSEQHSISQYATEGGSHLLDADDRKLIMNERKKLENIRKEYISKVSTIGYALNSDEVKPKVVTKPETAEQQIVEEVVEQAKPIDSFRSELLSNKEKFSNPTELIKHVKANLAKYLGQQGNQGKYATMYTELLNISGNVLPANLQVNIIDGTTTTADVIGYDKAVADGTSAWFASENGKNQINLRMDNNDINSKVIVHEFIHAATSNAIEAVRKEPAKYPKAKESLDKIERLYEHVKTKVQASNDSVIKYGITNIDEFIATGLTYPKFMDFLDSITDIPAEKRGMNRIATAFRSFVSNMLDVLYAVAGKGRKYNAKTLSAYEALLLDTAEFVSRSGDINTITGPKVLGAPRQQAINTVSNYTAKEVFESLDDGKLNADFKKQLNSLISDTTDKLFAALDYAYARSKESYSPEEIWQNALSEGRAPYTTAALEAGYKLSAQEQFAVEALEVTFKEVTHRGSVSTAYRTVANAYEEASKTLEPKDFHKGDWAEASADAQKLATDKYNYLFRTGKADYMARFTAMALGSQELNEMLTMKLKSSLFADKGDSRFEKLINFANRMTNKAVETLTSTSGQETVQSKLPILAKLLVDIDLKNRNKSVNMIEDTITKAEDLANNAVISTRDKLNSAASSPLRMFDNKYINIVKNTLKATQDGRSVISVFDAVRDFRNYENKNERLGFLGELANEIGEQNSAQQMGEKLLAYAKQNEGTAQRIRTVVKEDVLSHFADNGQKLTYNQRSAITTSLLRTDAQALIAEYGYDKVMQMMDSRSLVNKEIHVIEQGINNQVHINRARALAWYMVSGKGNETLAKNAYGIAYDAGLYSAFNMASEEYVKSIDNLVSLYAIKYTDAHQLKEAHKVMVDESKRPDKGGTYALMKYHEALAKESFTELFQDNPISYQKGYLPNIMNPHKELVVASNSADIGRLESAMYVRMGEVGKSSIDPNKTPAMMYYTEDAGNQRFISGAMALYNYGRKGTEINMTTPERVKAINDVRRGINTSVDYDPRKETSNKAIPTYDTEGNIIAFNYEMSNHVRDTYLDRNNDFSEIVGDYTAAGFNKMVLKDQNMNVADALIDEYKTNMRRDPKAYIYVGAGASDPVLAESWALIPQEVRKHIYQRTGMNGLYVHNQAYLTVFGTKKYSLTNTFDKYREQQNIAEKLFTGFMRTLFKDNARVRTAQGERMWQEMVSTLKNFIVIRNVSTALINIVSNSFLLMAHGVNPADIVKDTITSVKAGSEYRKSTAELIKLQNRQRIDVGNADAIQQRIDMLQQRIERNPLIDVINAGMFSGVVEDIDADNEAYTYSSGLQRKFEDKIDKIPKTVRTVAKHAFVQPGTPLYQFLHSATQYGDFAAKYSMYKHYTKQGKNMMSHDKAIAMAQNNFINYDVPTSKGMQYANDMGLVMFTKYNLRIQRALFNLLAKRPASAIGQAIIVSALSRLPYGIDPIVFNQIGSPFREGAFGLFSALDEPFPIQMLTKVF